MRGLTSVFPRSVDLIDTASRCYRDRMTFLAAPDRVKRWRTSPRWSSDPAAPDDKVTRSPLGGDDDAGGVMTGTGRERPRRIVARQIHAT